MERGQPIHNDWNGGKIITADAIDGLRTIETATVDTCITSPPYFGLRNYGVEGQVGLEPTLDEYIDKLVTIFREVRRTLKNDGTLWINIGDTYCSTAPGTFTTPLHIKGLSNDAAQARARFRPKNPEGMKPKDLIGVPWLVAFALRADGWFLRQDIIWEKPNCMPESVKDRCTKSHEYIFLLSKSPRYYFDYEAIKEPAVGFNNDPPAGSKGSCRPQTRLRKGNAKTFRGGGAYTDGHSFENSGHAERESHGNTKNATGLRNKRDVWTVPTKPYPCAHFATFPPNLIRPCVLAGSRPGGIILDPFFGAGTTGLVAVEEQRQYIGIELNPKYCEIAETRLAQIRI